MFDGRFKVFYSVWVIIEHHTKTSRGFWVQSFISDLSPETFGLPEGIKFNGLEYAILRVAEMIEKNPKLEFTIVELRYNYFPKPNKRQETTDIAKQQMYEDILNED